MFDGDTVADRGRGPRAQVTRGCANDFGSGGRYDGRGAGVKECSYTRQVSVIKTGTNAAGEHFVTYDNGKTWSPDPEQAAKSGVMVWWKKQ